MDDDDFISLEGWGMGKFPIRGGMAKVQGGYIGPNGGLGALPTVGSLVSKPKQPQPPKDEKKG